ncbi:hypothetical protein GCM10023116_48490 [Kistimonas scapharcae]|uniref:Holliday junction resolvase n=1 Tax=Kistimonas scapharcae TaxID=1036133 RepID=A0ABP8VC24_9GAMM
MPKGRGCKQKGDNFERELAAFLNEYAYGRSLCHRAPLSGGGSVISTGGADLTGTPGLFVEAKRVERCAFPNALEQAERNAEQTCSTEHPIVINRRNRQCMEESYVFLRLGDFLAFYHAWLEREGHPHSN